MIKLRIATKDQFCFIEEDFDSALPELIKGRYDTLHALMNGKETSPNAFYSYLIALMASDLSVWGSADNYEQLNDKQKEVVQSIKRFAKRMK